MRVTTVHLFTIPGFTTRPGFCRGGARTWFRTHGLDWQDFVKHGIDELQLAATGDALALALVDWAHRCGDDHGRE